MEVISHNAIYPVNVNEQNTVEIELLCSSKQFETYPGTESRSYRARRDRKGLQLWRRNCKQGI